MTKIAEIKEESPSLNLTVKIVTVREREYENDKGKGTYYFGIIGDETGTIPFTAWVFPPTVRQNDVVELRNCSVKAYNERLRVYVNSRSEVVLRPNDTMEVLRTYVEYKVKDLTTRDQYVAVSGIISGIQERKYSKDGKEGIVYNGFFRDETGTVRLSSFGVKLKEGLKAKISGARVQEYRGRIRISVNENSVITPVEFPEPQIPLYRITELANGISGIEISGICVLVGERSGLIMRCPECRRRVEGDRCEEHPGETPVKDLYAYFTLEDGTSTIQVSAGKDAMKGYTGLDVEELDYTPEERQSVSEKVMEKFLGKPVLLLGESVMSGQGLNFRALEVHPVDKNVISRVESLMKREVN